ncbi:NADH dehydrogenase ubiquinone Fe-S protein 4 [Sphingomonas sp. BK580]|uniref:NADH dehydrogenase ubiquinone Fe-S protein 4 n=1 Tax=Sphingomonas sp. BK580 TaxID=2586972 RepID=UPI0018302854|nr:NADH dehydrogenase ubiquinone Fe-S protein 4 [Sphingomonas sp. BK580]MBB3691429.1 hypothetical protein [Sphingomonas sp. BK580]
MAHVRIYRHQGLGSPVLQKERFGWTLEFLSDSPQRADALTGWAGGADTQAQVRLIFPTSAEAVAYCSREGLSYTLQDAPRRRLLLQSYADNFR